MRAIAKMFSPSIFPPFSHLCTAGCVTPHARANADWPPPMISIALRTALTESGLGLFMPQKYNLSYLFVNNFSYLTEYNFGNRFAIMESLASRIKSRMETLNLNQEQLAKLSGLSQVSIHKILTGKTKKTKNADQLAKALGCSIDWLLTGTGENMENNIDLSPERRTLIKKVPIIPWNFFLEGADMQSIREGWALTTHDMSSRAFALKLKNDIMEPRIPSGATLLVDPDSQPQHGDVVIIRIDKHSEAICRTLVVDGGKKYLKPENPRFSILELPKNSTIYGVVKQIILDL